jgi:hypothetical protein
MITQHVVSFGDEVTLTRLPAGRAEGYVWLSFVAQGIELLPGPEEAWRIPDHVRITWLDGSAADIVEVETSGNETLHRFGLVIRDAGYNTLTIRYVEDDNTISIENVPLPGF